MPAITSPVLIGVARGRQDGAGVWGIPISGPRRWLFQLRGPGGAKILGQVRAYTSVWVKWGINPPLHMCYHENGARAKWTPKSHQEHTAKWHLLRGERTWSIGTYVYHDYRTATGFKTTQVRITRREVIKGQVKYYGVLCRAGKAIWSPGQWREEAVTPAHWSTRAIDPVTGVACDELGTT